MLSSRGSSQPRDCTRVSYVSCIGRQVLWTRVSLGKISSYNPLPPAIYLIFNFLVLHGEPEPLFPNCIKWLMFTSHGKSGVEPGLELSSHNRCTPAPSLVHHDILSSLWGRICSWSLFHVFPPSLTLIITSESRQLVLPTHRPGSHTLI